MSAEPLSVLVSPIERPSIVMAHLAWVVGFTICWGTLSYVALTIAVLSGGYGFTLSGAGLMATVELSAMAIMGMAGGPIGSRVSWRTVAVVGALLGAAGNVATAMTHGVTLLSLSRAVAGIGAGLVAAAANTSMSRAGDPERVFATANVGNVVLSAAFLAGMPVIYTRFAYPAYFLAYACFYVVSAAALAFLPAGGEHPEKGAPRGDGAGRFAPGGVAAIAGAFLLWLAYSSLWSVCEPLAASLGMSEERIGFVFGIATLAGLLGGLLAWWSGKRMRPLVPLLISALSLCACFVGLTVTHSASVYSIVMCLFGVALCACIPYLMTFAAFIDASGGVPRVLGAWMPVATALGPVIGARTAEYFSFPTVGYLTASAVLASCVIFLGAQRRAFSAGHLTARSGMQPPATS